MEEILLMLEPDFVWPQPMQPTIAETTPEFRTRRQGPTSLRMWGNIHKYLHYISRQYCNWFGIPFDHQFMDLPFGLVLKWTHEASIEEAMAMHLAHEAGMPVPKVLCCGEHPEEELTQGRFSILMTRLPGSPASDFERDVKQPWVDELKQCLESMRRWQGPENRICSVIETPIHTDRTAIGLMGPFESETELYDRLHFRKGSTGYYSPEEYETAISQVRKLRERPHWVTFTHGGLVPENILVDEDGHLSGIQGWEHAGWCPDYWEFTHPLHLGAGNGWNQILLWLGGDQYLEELEGDIALRLLTRGSYLFRDASQPRGTEEIFTDTRDLPETPVKNRIYSSFGGLDY
ncbi:hypothetical protein FQN54_009844 [Arachnomyces sp. PD_36]|nr:hypothetical protein FQN54_009844 [Arachnomyces sp. PD_36]